MGRFFSLLGLAILVALWEYAVAPFLPSWLAVHPFIPLLVLLLAFARRSSTVFLFAAMVGILLETVIGGYGILYPEIRTCIVAGGLILLGTGWFSNRSVYALLLLTVVARALDWGVVSAIYGLSRWLGAGTAVSFSLSSVWHWLIWDLIWVWTGFVLVSWTKRALRPYLPARFRG